MLYALNIPSSSKTCHCNLKMLAQCILIDASTMCKYMDSIWALSSLLWRGRACFFWKESVSIYKIMAKSAQIWSRVSYFWWMTLCVCVCKYVNKRRERERERDTMFKLDVIQWFWKKCNCSGIVLLHPQPLLGSHHHLFPSASLGNIVSLFLILFFHSISPLISSQLRVNGRL